MMSGEIFKEPFVDVFVTDSEQVAFSLPLLNNTSFSFSRAFPNTQLDNKPDIFEKSDARENTKFKDELLRAPSKIHVEDLQEADPFHKTDKSSQAFFNTKSIEKAKWQQNNKTVDLPTQNLTAELMQKQAVCTHNLNVGDFVYSGDTIGKCHIGEWTGPLVIAASGKVIRISQSKVILQKMQPVLYYSQASAHVQEGEWVEQNAPILTLTHQTLLTGDIVQGIPRIEQLFEAPHSPPSGMREKAYLHETLHSQLRDIFRLNWSKYNLPMAVRQSLEQIQHILVESLQKVYLSQGVLIADKHIEIVVRQMTSRALVLDSGDTGLLLQELLPVQQIEKANLVSPGQKAVYAPAVVGLTRSALESDSFISAASFQETTRVLSRDATTGKTDFLRGLKERVVIGDLIGAGTGLDAYFVYGLVTPEVIPDGKSLSAMQIPMMEPKMSSTLSSI